MRDVRERRLAGNLIVFTEDEPVIEGHFI